MQTNNITIWALIDAQSNMIAMLRREIADLRRMLDGNEPIYSDQPAIDGSEPDHETISGHDDQLTEKEIFIASDGW